MLCRHKYCGATFLTLKILLCLKTHLFIPLFKTLFKCVDTGLIEISWLPNYSKIKIHNSVYNSCNFYFQSISKDIKRSLE